MLATASTTAFTAVPWHGDQTPAYNPDDRDSYEGFGRVNHGTAVDAVSRNLASGENETTEVLGLDIPDDEQAAAGYVTGPGEYEIGVSFEGYEGTDADLTTGEPHIDLVVYDALDPEGVDDDAPATGDPMIVDSYRGVSDPDRGVTVSLSADDVYQVVVKLVPVPGDGTTQLAGTAAELPDGGEGLLFNGADVQVNVELEVEED